jgi:tellurite resistance protein TerC
MGTPALWIGFNIVVLVLLALDLWVFHRHAHRISLRQAAFWSAFWVALSLGFNYWILRTYGGPVALDFFTGYVVEKSLSVDNLFVFLLIFRSFGIEPRYQHRVLFWGVLGALVLRGLFVGAGAALVHRFDWFLYLFGAFLIAAGARTMFKGHPEFDPEQSSMLRWMGGVLRIAKGHTGERFFVVEENGRRAVTRLFLALVVIDGADLIFALDSIPAIFGITQDPFLVYTSNVCAILGLRALYMLLAGVMPMFRYLDAGISAVLIFIGGKMLVEPWFHVPTPLALAVVASLLFMAVAASFVARRGSNGAQG